MDKKVVVIESPYAGDVERNEKYARECMLDSLKRGEAPFVSHLLYTQVLDDTNIEERQWGLAAGWSWLRVAELQAVYIDLGISHGMMRGIEIAKRLGIPTEMRKLYS